MTKKNNLSDKQIRNLFLTGPPSSGRTTAIKKVLAKIERKATGFHTEEIKKRGKRVVFLMKALDAPNVVLGTIAVGGTDFIRKVKERKDIKIYEVTAQNRNELPEQLIEEIERLLERTDAYYWIGEFRD
jgi:nucleoside-triphosphatase THEP1